MTIRRSTERNKVSREGALRIDQRLTEGPDMFVLRAFAKAIPHMAANECLAITQWMHAKARDPLTMKAYLKETERQRTERAIREFLSRKRRGL